MRKTIFENQDNKAISERFDFVKDTFDSVISHEIEYKEGGVYMDDNQILTKEGNRPSLHFFGCKKDKMTEDGAFNGVKKMADSFPKFLLNETYLTRWSCVASISKIPSVPSLLPSLTNITS